MVVHGFRVSKLSPFTTFLVRGQAYIIVQFSVDAFSQFSIQPFKKAKTNFGSYTKNSRVPGHYITTIYNFYTMGGQVYMCSCLVLVLVLYRVPDFQHCLNKASRMKKQI